MAKLEQEAHRIAAKALERQEQALTELRARTGTLLTASSLIASFLGGQALARQGLSWCIAGLIFALDGPAAYGALYEVRDDQEEVDRRLAYWLQSFREANHPTVKRLTSSFEVAGFALLIEIGFLALALALGRWIFDLSNQLPRHRLPRRRSPRPRPQGLAFPRLAAAVGRTASSASLPGRAAHAGETGGFSAAQGVEDRPTPARGEEALLPDPESR